MHLKILLYRPLLSSSMLRGHLSDPSSPISVCIQAATLMTRIGETTFQNYSWPWPGCGMFGHQMVQAAEIHVLSIVVAELASADSLAMDSVYKPAQELFTRTLDLIKGYTSLLAMPELLVEVSALEQSVKNHIMTRSTQVQMQRHQSMDRLQPITPFAILQQQHQHKQLQQLQQQNQQQQYMYRHQTSNSQSHDITSSNPGHLTGVPASVSTVKIPISPQESRMYSPLPSVQPNTLGFHSAFRQHYQHRPQEHASHHEPEEVRQQCTPSYQEEDPAALFGMSSSMSLYSPSSTSLAGGDLFAFLQPSETLAPINDILNLQNDIGSIDVGCDGQQGHLAQMNGHHLNHTRDFSSSTLPEENSSATAISSLPSVKTETIHDSNHGLEVLSLPPHKPPKRVLYHNTGSTTSSNRSASQKPPVPKKPTRLVMPIGGGGALRGNMGVDRDQVFSSANDRLSMMPPPTAAATRSIKVLPAQSQLYGMGALINSLAPDQTNYPPTTAAESYQSTVAVMNEQDNEELNYGDTYALEFWQKPNPQMAGRRAPSHNGRVL
ncbi:hypothetical protein BG004_001408 [Podila humilis]|nr:hypothetical protein BG004_001408 [Podila humilis]